MEEVVCPWCTQYIDLVNGIYDIDYGLCHCCSSDEEEYFCMSHLTQCSECGIYGCDGCGTVNSCTECQTLYCLNCMNNDNPNFDGSCVKCDRLYWCYKCISDTGHCPDCIIEENQ